jgi:hypothetical protein
VGQTSDGDYAEPEVADYAEPLADAICAHLATWVVECVRRTMEAWNGTFPPEVAFASEVAGQLAVEATGGALRGLLAADIDDQVTTPLALVRSAVKYPTEVLRQVGVPPVERDPFAVAAFPDDTYDLSPSALSDIDPSLAELGIAWGAAKAFEHRRRHSDRRQPDPSPGAEQDAVQENELHDP